MLLLGNERHGLAPELLARCDSVVRLPSRGVKNSMNVGVAFGMCGYEIVRQWTSLPTESTLLSPSHVRGGAEGDRL